MSRAISIGIQDLSETGSQVDTQERFAAEQCGPGRRAAHDHQDHDHEEHAEQDQATELRTFRPLAGWSPESFAREQIRGLVRQIFFSQVPAIRQVVFSAIDAETDIRRICRRVGETLALETTARIAIVGEYPKVIEVKALNEKAASESAVRNVSATMRQTATRMRNNLWLVPLDRGGKDCFSGALLRSHMGNLRNEFQYSIVESAPASLSNETTAMAALADGVVLVLSAHRTRRAIARNIKERLDFAQVRILGTVLSERMFPIPEMIYRRL
jgi:hypothetical protein